MLYCGACPPCHTRVRSSKHHLVQAVPFTQLNHVQSCPSNTAAALPKSSSCGRICHIGVPSTRLDNRLRLSRRVPIYTKYISCPNLPCKQKHGWGLFCHGRVLDVSSRSSSSKTEKTRDTAQKNAKKCRYFLWCRKTIEKKVHIYNI